MGTGTYFYSSVVLIIAGLLAPPGTGTAAGNGASTGHGTVITPAVRLATGPTSLSKAPRLPSLKAGFSTQAGGGFDSGRGAAKRYTPIRPDVISMVNGPGSTQVLMGGWSTWWLNVGDKPLVSIAGRDGGGAYSSPGVIDGVGVSGAARLAVRNASGSSKWLEEFDRCEALLAPGTATWRCTDTEMGIRLNLTTFPLHTGQTGIVLRATVLPRGAATLVWAVAFTGKNDTVAVGPSNSNQTKPRPKALALARLNAVYACTWANPRCSLCDSIERFKL